MMDEKKMLKLQNGSDIRGVAMEGVEGEAVTLGHDAANVIGAAFVNFLAEKIGKPASKLKIAIGHDSRLSAISLKEAAIEGAMNLGARMFDCGLCSTPAMYMSTVFEDTQMDGAIMITASHLPYNRNGLKFFTAEGGLEKEDIKTILLAAARLEPVRYDISDVEKLDLIDLYAAYLRDKIRVGANLEENYMQPLAGMKIVVDAGNGAGGFFARKVLKPLGADTTGSKYLDPDGRFPNHIPNPENKEAMASIKKIVKDSHADFGLIFDTDVDRMGAVLSDGKEINRNALIAMIAAILAPDNPGSTIVTDSVTSDELTEFLEGSLHLKHHRFKRGYKNVINECIRLNEEGIDCPLAIETSGHGALRENYYLDDGAYLAVKLIIAAAKARRKDMHLTNLIEELGYPADAREYRLNISGLEDYRAYGYKVLEEFKELARARGIQVASPSYEGVRLVFPDEGWILLRLSLHDPNMPMNIEGKHDGDCEKLVKIARELVSGFVHLDYSVIH